MRTDASPLEIIRDRQLVAPVSVLDIAGDFGLRGFRGEWTNGASGCIRKDRKRGGKSGFAIFTNKDHGRTRRRFTIAHEIGHFVLHRNKIDREVIDDGLYRSRLNGDLEVQANDFAAFVLMPWDLIVREMKHGRDTVEELAQAFEVPKSAMAIARLSLRNRLIMPAQPPRLTATPSARVHPDSGSLCDGVTVTVGITHDLLRRPFS